MAKPKLKSTSVSVRGDRDYINTLRALAAKRGITLAELTRRALDEAYGDEAEAMSSFFANDVASKQQTLHEVEASL
jgi:hypothetical protein